MKVDPNPNSGRDGRLGAVPSLDYRQVRTIAEFGVRGAKTCYLVVRTYPRINQPNGAMLRFFNVAERRKPSGER